MIYLNRKSPNLIHTLDQLREVAIPPPKLDNVPNAGRRYHALPHARLAEFLFEFLVKRGWGLGCPAYAVSKDGRDAVISTAVPGLPLPPLEAGAYALALWNPHRGHHAVTLYGGAVTAPGLVGVPLAAWSLGRHVGNDLRLRKNLDSALGKYLLCAADFRKEIARLRGIVVSPSVGLAFLGEVVRRRLITWGQAGAAYEHDLAGPADRSLWEVLLAACRQVRKAPAVHQPRRAFRIFEHLTLYSAVMEMTLGAQWRPSKFSEVWR